LHGQGLLGQGGSDGVARVGPEEFKQRLEKTPGAILVDVRTPEEYREGHLAKSLLIPVDRVAASAASALPKKDAPLLVYCRSGSRSSVAAATLKKMGYTNITDLSTGILGWSRQGYPVVRD
jgi:rhodanese-related sulfurtransferase